MSAITYQPNELPWRVVENTRRDPATDEYETTLWVVDQSGFHVADVGFYPEEDICSDDNCRARAKLIAASPKLLAAVQAIANMLSPNVLPVNGMMARYDHALMVREEADRAFEIARAAINEATVP